MPVGQKYCNGIAPYEYNGEKMTCRQYAVSGQRKGEAHPILSIHKSVVIRYPSRVIQRHDYKRICNDVKEIADELKTLAIHGDGYTPNNAI